MTANSIFSRGHRVFSASVRSSSTDLCRQLHELWKPREKGLAFSLSAALRALLIVVAFLASAAGASAQTVTVTAPNGGEFVGVGTGVSINWTTTGSIGSDVKIELWKGGVLNRVIAYIVPTANGTYNWTVPAGQALGTDYKIKVYSRTTLSILDFSDAEFTIGQPSITTTSPNGGESYFTGSTQSITWTTLGNVGTDLKIELWSAGALHQVLTYSVPTALGSYSWAIPNSLPAGSAYKIKIYSRTNTSILDYSDADFSVVQPSITLTSPNGGETLETGTSHIVTWNSAGNVGADAKIELWKAGVLDRVIAYTVPVADGTYSWPVPATLTPGTDYTIKIYSRTNLSIADFSDANFTVFQPSITVTSPNGGETWQAGSTQSITWSTAGNVGPEVKLELWKAGVLDRTIAYIVPSTPGTYNWTIPTALATGNDYTVRVYSRSNVNISDTSDAAFSVISPSISLLSPNGGESWQVGTTNAITWSVVGDIGPEVKIELWKAGVLDRVLAYTVPTADATYNWVIPSTLAPGSDYTVKIYSRTVTSISDVSASAFTVFKPSVTVTAPNGGESLEAGTSVDITWSTIGDIGPEVKIELLKGGVLDRVIEYVVPTTPSTYTWNIPANLAAGSDYRVNVYSRSTVSIADTSDTNFAVYQPSLTVTSPNGGETWQAGTTQNITWSAQGNVGADVKIELWNNNALDRVIEYSVPTATGSYSWAIPGALASGSNYQVKVYSRTNTAIQDLSDAVFAIVRPTVTVGSPNGGEQWTAGQAQTILWSSTGDIGPEVKLELWKGLALDRVIAFIVPTSPGEYLWNVPANLVDGTDYRVRVYSRSNVSIEDYSDAEFTVSHPSITLTAPNGGEAWEKGTSQSITWSTIGDVGANVGIDLFKGGIFQETIAASVPTIDGAYSWSISSSLADGADYSLRIYSLTNASAEDFSDAYFSLASLASADLEWSTFLGGSGYEYGAGITHDEFGNVVICGFSDSPDFPATAGAYTTSPSVDGQAFVSKFDASGSTLVFSSVIGGSGVDEFAGVTFDGDGNLCVLGTSSSPDYPFITQTFGTRAGLDLAVVKIAPVSGDLLMAVCIAGSDEDTVWANHTIVVDAAGDLYCTGFTRSSDFVVTPGAYQTTWYGNNSRDGFVTKLSGDGQTVLYSTYLGGSGQDHIHGLSVMPSGEAIVIGRTGSVDYPVTPGAYQQVFAGNRDVVVSKLNASGSALVYSTFIGGTDNDGGWDMALDPDGSVYVSGNTRSTDYPVTPGATQPSHSSPGTSDMIVSKLSADGTTLEASTYWGGSGNENAYTMVRDRYGNIWLSGESASPDMYTTPGALDTTFNGVDDVVLVALTGDLSTPLYSTFFGATGSDNSGTIAVDDVLNVFLVGWTESSDFPVTVGSYDTSYNGGEDVVVAKIQPSFADADADGMPDWWETRYGLNPAIDDAGVDTDGDGLENAIEFVYATNPTDADTDIDGLSDGAEVDTHGTDPLDADSDDDGYSDGAEISAGTDPLDAMSNPASVGGVLWSTFLGGSGDDYPTEIVVDAQGYVYISGETASPDFPTSVGAYQVNPTGDYDGFVTKIDPSGTSIVFSTLLGGSSTDYVEHLTLDSTGNVYVMAQTYSYDFPVFTANFGPGGGSDAVVTKLSSNGDSLLLSTRIGGSADEITTGNRCIQLDGAGNIYIASHTASGDFPTTGGAYQTSFAGGTHDAYVTKLDPTATSLLYSTYVGGTGSDRILGIAITAADEVVAVGRTNSTNYPVTPGAIQGSHNGGIDGLITKLSASGDSLVYSTYVGGAGADDFWDVDLDATGNIYAAGRTTSTTYPMAGGGYVSAGALGGSQEVTLVKVDPSGAHLATAIVSGGSWDIGLCLMLDPSGLVWVTGETASADFPTTAGAFQATYNGGANDIFVSRLTSDLTDLTYSTFLGATGDDNSGLVAAMSNGDIAVAGWTDSADFPTTPGAFDTTHNGVMDISVTVLRPIAVDSDGDGMPDWWEFEYGLNPAVDDSGDDLDSDGLTNGAEFGIGTIPSNTDSDADGIDDGTEVNSLGTNPTNSDSDGDGLTDGDEVNTHSTNPLDADSDDDLYSDGMEVAAGTDPLDGNDHPIAPQTLSWLVEPGDNGDGYGNNVASYPDGSTVVSGALTGSATFGAGEPNETTLTAPPSSGLGTTGGYLAKYNPDGTLAWAKLTCSSPYYAEAGSHEILPDGSIISGIAFGFAVSLEPGLPNQVDLTVPYLAYCTAMYNENGERLWYKYTDGYFTDGRVGRQGLNLGSDGEAYLTGGFAGTLSWASTGVSLTNNSSYRNAFLVKVLPNGTIEWAKQFGDTYSGHAVGTATEELPNKDIAFLGTSPAGAVLGTTQSGPLTNVFGGDFLALYDSAGTCAWISEAPGAAFRDVSISPTANSILVAGFISSSAQFDIGGSLETTVNGPAIFLASYSVGGAFEWIKSSPLSGAAGFNVGSLESIPGGAVLMTGVYTGSVTFGSGEPNETTLTAIAAGRDSIFNAAYMPNGTLISARTLLGAVSEVSSVPVNNTDISGSDTAVSTNGDLYILGSYRRAAVFSPGTPTQEYLSNPSESSEFTYLARFTFPVDADNDGMADWWESEYGLNVGVDDSADDGDSDGLTNLAEFLAATNPGVSDSDADGLNDGVEVGTHGTNPLDDDSDNDGLDDGVEIGTHGTNPLSDDSDNDGLTDGDEITTNLTDPLDSDSDDDLYSDSSEVEAGTDPLDGNSHPIASQSLSWSAKIGDTGDDYPNNVGHAPDGSVIASGALCGTATFGAGEPNETTLTAPPNAGYGPTASYLAKYNPDGTLAWAKISGVSSNYAEGGSPEIQSDGSILVGTAFLWSVTLEQGAPGEMSFSAPVFAYYLAKYSPNGDLLWAKPTGGSLDDARISRQGINSGRNGFYYVTGEYHGSLSWPSSNITLVNTTAYRNGFYFKYSPNGELLWANQITQENTGDAGARASAELPNGASALIGFAPGGSVFGQTMSGPLTNAYGGDFLAYYSVVGICEWVVEAPGATIRDVSATPDGNTILVAGIVEYGANFDIGGSLETYVSGPAIFMAGYSYSGDLLWIKSSPITGEEEFDVDSIESLPGGAALVTGVYTGAVTFEPGQPNETVLTVVDEARASVFSTAYAPNGDLLAARNIAAAVNTVNNIYAYGSMINIQDTSVSSVGELVVIGEYVRGIVLSPNTPTEQYLDNPSDVEELSYLAQFAFPVDSDGDGMADWWETQHGLNSAVDDAADDGDLDGLSNLAEFLASTNPAVADTDGDGLDDGAETTTHGTNPNAADTDADGASDGDEVLAGTDPQNANSNPTQVAGMPWSTFLGGSGEDYPAELLTDASGNVYIAGDTSSVDFPTQSGAYQMTLGGDVDGFVTKLDPTGTTLVFSTFVGGTGTDYLENMTFDSLGNLCVLGQTDSPDYPTTVMIGSGGGSDLALIKLNASGDTLLASTRMGGSGDEVTFGNRSIAVDSVDSLYIGGFTNSGDFPTTSGAYQESLQASENGIVAKLSADASTVVYSTYVGASARTRLFGLAVTATGEVVSTGKVFAAGMPTTPGAYQPNFGGGSSDAFLTTFSADGTSIVASTYIGGWGLDDSWDIALDTNGDAFFVGRTDSPDFPVTGGGNHAPPAVLGLRDVTIAHVSADATNLFAAARLGGSAGEIGLCLVLDENGFVWVTGETVSNNFPVTAGALDTSYNGGSHDVFVSQLTPNLVHVTYSTFLGGSSGDSSGLIASAGAGDVFVASYTTSSDFPTTSGAFDTTFNSANPADHDVAITKIHTAGTLTDTDSDSLPDWWEIQFGTDPNSDDAAADLDFDGLSNALEYTNYTDPNDIDTDNDALADGDEVLVHGTNPVSSDSDADRVPDYEELYFHSTNPLVKDSDGDSLEDGDELQVFGTNPAASDSDGDGLDDNIEIFTYGTTPTNSDSDADGLSDGAEVLTHLTNPWAVDSDGDTLSDGDEINLYNTNPLVPDDADGDGLADPLETNYGSDPNDADSDDDGLSDGQEVYSYGTNPMLADSDGDTLSDTAELGYPNNAGTSTCGTVSLAMVNAIDGECGLIYSAVGGDWNSTDYDANGMIDRWEVAQVIGVLSNPAHPLYDETACVFLANRQEGYAQLSLVGYESVASNGWAALATVSAGMHAVLQTIIPGGTYQLVVSDAFASSGDVDGDGRSNQTEYNLVVSTGGSYDDYRGLNGHLPTSPNNSDSDGDGRSDGDELLTDGTNPMDYDSDNDGASDGSEVAGGSDPLDPLDTPAANPATLSWSTFLGGSADDAVADVAVYSTSAIAGQGEIYIFGTTASSDFPTTTGAYAEAFVGGASDVFVTKLNATGTSMVFSTLLGGSDLEYADSMLIDAGGDAYLFGNTASSDFPTTGSAYSQTFAGGGADFFVTKLAATGDAIVFSTYLGGSGTDDGDACGAIALDSAGDIYITGSTDSTDFPTHGTAYDSTLAGGTDAIVAKLSANASTLIYGTYIGGSLDDSGHGIEIDGSGYAYIGGQTFSDDFPVSSGAFDSSRAPGIGGLSERDVFITKVATDGSDVEYSTYLGGSNKDGCWDIELGPSGTVYVTGNSSSYDFPIVWPAYAYPSGMDDVYVTQLNSTGTGLVHSTVVGGSNDENPTSIAVDSVYNVWLAGNGASSNMPTTWNAYKNIFSGDRDAFVMCLNASLDSLLYSTYLGGSGRESVGYIALDGYGSIVASGRTTSSNFPVTSGTIDDTLNDGTNSLMDVFIARLTPNAIYADTDFDGMTDWWEATYGTNAALDDASDDMDSDGLTNIEEFYAQTQPGLADTDSDSKSDYDEIHVYLTNPNNGGLRPGGIIITDLDHNGRVNAVDVQLVINAALGINLGPVSGDSNGDGDMTAVDIQLVINAALGL